MEYFAFQWHITKACDQRCKHCYIYALGSHAKFREMAVEDMVKVIGNCRTFCKKAGRMPYFYLTGGDPILHPQFWTLAKLLRERDLPFAILGNPFHLSDEVCERLAACGCRKYQLSLDGLRDTHDRIRRPGSYDETLAAIPPLKRAGISVAVMATVSKMERGGNSLSSGCGGGARGGCLCICPVLSLTCRPGYHLFAPGIPGHDGAVLGEVPEI